MLTVEKSRGCGDFPLIINPLIGVQISHVSVTIRSSNIRISPEIIKKSPMTMKINADGLESDAMYEITVRGIKASEHAKPAPFCKQFTYSR